MTSPIVEVRNLVKEFPNIVAVDDVSFKIHKGEVVVIIGPSGSGKSTLLRCLNRLVEPTSGDVFIEGEKITDPRVDIDKIRRDMGVVFQSFNLFLHLTVRKNITLPLTKVLGFTPEEARIRAEEVLTTVGLLEKANSYPGELSGGQQQRAAIARVLAMEPKIIMFDEPTSALDPELIGEVLKVMRRLAFELHYTLLVVTHEMHFAREVASRVIVLDNGKMIEEGAPEILDNPKTERLKKFLSKITSH